MSFVQICVNLLTDVQVLKSSPQLFHRLTPLNDMLRVFVFAHTCYFLIMHIPPEMCLFSLI